MLDAIALGSVAAALVLFAFPPSNRLGAYEAAQIFVSFATRPALVVFVVEIVVHTIVRASAQRSGAHPDSHQGAPAGWPKRGQRIRRVLLLPLLDATVLGLIVGVLFINIYIDHNPMNVRDFDRGRIDFAHLTTMFALFSVPVAIIVLVVELIVHRLVAALQRPGLRRAKS